MDDKKFHKAIRDIKKINTPETLKRNLINTSLILTAYELMKYSLIDQRKNFFEIEGKPPSKTYRNEIEQFRKELPKEFRKYPLLVSARWFQKYDALDKTDFENIEKIWRYRNEVTHELIKFLVDSDFEVDVKYLLQIRDIVEKVDIWWIREFVIPCDPDFDQVEVKDAAIRSGRMDILDHLISIAFELNLGMEEDKSGLVH